MDIAQLIQSASSIPSATELGPTSGVAVDHIESTLRLLIIDDEIQQDDMLVRLLELEGIDATTVQAGSVGLECARTRAFDAILLDLKLPDILGMTVLSFIRAERIFTPVIVYSGYFLDTDHEEKALQMGAAAFLAKPIFDPEELAAMVRRLAAAKLQPNDVLPRSARPSPRAGRGSSPARRREIPGLAVLHRRAFEGDIAAMDEIVRLLLPNLCGRLRHFFPINGDDWIDCAVEDALLEYCADPSRYDPKRGRSLDSYLEYNAARNALNARASVRRRLTHETTNVMADFWEALRAPSPEEPTEELDQLSGMIATVRASLTPPEQLVHDLQMADVHDTRVYARALDLEHLPRQEQVRRVRHLTNAVAHKVRRALIRLRDQLFVGSNG